MLSRILASWLIIIAVLPFTAPFSTVTVGNVFGRGVDTPRKVDLHRSIPGGAFELTGLEAAVTATDLATDQTGADVRPVAASRYDTRLMPAVQPGTQTINPAATFHGSWLDSAADRKSVPAQGPAILRV